MNDPQGIFLGDFPGEEAASGIGCCFLPFAKVCVGQINGRASLVLAGAVQAVEQHILHTVVFGQDSVGSGSLPVGHVGCDLLTGLSVPDNVVAVNGFLSGLRDEKASAVLADCNLGIRQKKVLKQEYVILGFRTEQIL